MSHSATLDTLSIARRLKSRGVSQEQVEAIADELKVASDAARDELVTLSALDAKLAELKNELLKWMFGGFLGMFIMLASVLLKLSGG